MIILMKTNWGTTLRGARVNRQRPVGREWVATCESQNRHFGKKKRLLLV